MDEQQQEPPPEATRDAHGRFLPGVSGNPAGKKPGTRSWATGVREELRTKAVLPLLASLHRQGMAGDVGAAKLVLSYALPALRPGDLTDELADPTSSLGDQARAIVGKMSGGELSPAEAKDALEVITAAAQVDEIEMLRRRLDELEAMLQPGGHHVPG